RQAQNNAGSGRALTGPERAAVLMLALGEQHGERVWKLLDDDEVRQISIVMSQLGTVEAESVESLLLHFVGRLSASGALMGTFDATERLRQQYLPEELSLDVVNRMLKMEAVQKEVIERLEATLRTEFMSNLSQTRRRDAHEVMAEIFNNFDRQTETRFLTALEEDNRDSAERIKTLMFTFDDLTRLDTASAQTLMRHVDKDKLTVALKGATELVRQFFLSNMSTRAAKMLLDDMQALGPVRLRDVDEAQSQLVNLAKALAGKGEILISKNRSDEELIY